MFYRARPAQDAYTLSLGGMTAVASYVAAPAVVADRINKIRDARMKNIRQDPKQIQRRCMHSRRLPAHWCYA